MTTGEISGGTTLPAQTFAYQNDVAGKTFVSVASAPWCPSDRLLLGDFNGDGRTDQLCWNGTAGHEVALATALASTRRRSG